jgi:hypothetical protein
MHLSKLLTAAMAERMCIQNPEDIRFIEQNQALKHQCIFKVHKITRLTSINYMLEGDNSEHPSTEFSISAH